MKNAILAQFEELFTSKTKQHPNFRPGDTIRVHYKIEESKTGAKEKKFRIQVFEGVCLRFHRGTTSASFTVRKVGANAVGVERVFAYHSPYIDRIDIVSGGAVRRSRLYYLRSLAGKAARIKSRRLKAGEPTSTLGFEKAAKEKRPKADKGDKKEKAAKSKTKTKKAAKKKKAKA